MADDMKNLPPAAAEALLLCIEALDVARKTLLEIYGHSPAAMAIINEAFVCQAIGGLKTYGGAEFAARRLRAGAERVLELGKPLDG